MERVRFSVLKCAVCDVLFFTISFSGPCILWLLFWEVAQSQGYQGYASTTASAPSDAEVVDSC